MGNLTRVLMAGWILLLTMTAVHAAAVPDEARRHMLRGQAALEMAKSQSDLQLAIREMERAAEIAPEWPAAHFNLGLVRSKAGDYAGAIASYRRYLELAPDAADAQKVRDELVKLEYRQERVKFQKDLQGAWMSSDARLYTLTLRDGVLHISTTGKLMTNKDLEELYGPIVGRLNMPVNYSVPFEMSGTITGDDVAGQWKRSSFKADACEVPEDSGNFKGKISLQGDRITLQFTKKRFRIVNVTSVMLLGDSVCTENKEIGQEEETLVLQGPLGHGRIREGIWLVAAAENPYQAPVAFEVRNDVTPEGLRSDDVLLAIDGQDMTHATLADIWMHLYGEPNTAAQIKVWRKGVAEPLTIAMIRYPPPPKQQARGASATSSACFIATAAYGSPFEQHVATLRTFRDEHLLTNAPGRWFVAQYYEHSPPVADYIRERPWLRATVRGVLTPIVQAILHPLPALLLSILFVGGVISLRRRFRTVAAGR